MMKSAAVRRFIVCLGIFSILIGLRLADNGLLMFTRGGTYTVFDGHDRATVYKSAPLLNTRGAYERMDLAGDASDALVLLETMRARDIRVETVEGITVYYAFVPAISRKVTLGGRDVNVMIALSGGNMTVGSPLIKGSF